MEKQAVATETFTYKELKKKTVADLREIAVGIEHESVQGYTQMNKEHLLQGLCKALNIDMREHHQVVGINKTGIKARIKSLKQKRDETAAARNRVEHRTILRKIHQMKRKLHKATV